MLEDRLLFVDQHEFAVSADHPRNRIGQRLRGADLPVFHDLDRAAPIALDEEALQKALEMLLLARTAQENGRGVEIFRVTGIENVVFRSLGRIIVEVGAGPHLNGRPLGGWRTLRVEVSKKLRVGPRLIARMRTGRECRSVARRRKNAVLVGDHGFGPLLEFDHDEIGVRRFVVPGEQNVDPFRAGRNLVLDGNARVFRQRSVVQGIRDVLQRRLPGALLPGRRPAAFLLGKIHLQRLDDRAVARVFDETGLVAFVDDHAWGACAMKTVLGGPDLLMKTLRCERSTT